MSLARRLRLLPVSLAMLCSMAPAAWATWPSEPNVNVPICTAPNGQYNPAMTSDGAGGAIVTWFDQRSGTSDIYAQRVNSAGTPLWTADGVVLCIAPSNQTQPAIIADGAGGAIVVWYDFRNGNGDLYAQRVNANGKVLWPDDGVALCTAAHDQYEFTLIADGAGGAIVAWQDARNGADYDIYAQWLNEVGLPQWTADGVAVSTAASSQYSPTIVSDGDDGAIVTWDDFRNGADWNIYAQRLSATGVPQWTAEGLSLCSAAGQQYNPVIVSDGDGGAIVTWFGIGIYAQRVNKAGVTLWPTDGIALATAAGGQSNPTIVSDGAGGAIVSWFDYRSGNPDIYARRVSAAGTPQWTANGVALCVAANNQFNPMLAPDGAGGAIVTWYDVRSGTSDIYAQRVNAAGAPQWTANGVVVCSAANDELNPRIVPAGAGGAIVAWYDQRSGSSHIYAQNLNADGTLGGAIVSVPPTPGAASFALRGVQPNPSFGELHVSFALSDDAPAALELFDLHGRRLESVAVGGLGAGAHVVPLAAHAPSLAPGIYGVRLTQGSRRGFCKVVIVR